jgi:hypothetical protein
VDHVHAEQQGDVQPRFLDCDPLQRAGRPGAGDVELGADPAGADQSALGIVDPAVGAALPAAWALDELADLLLDRHPGEQILDAGGGALDLLRRGRGGGGEKQKEGKKQSRDPSPRHRSSPRLLTLT